MDAIRSKLLLVAALLVAACSDRPVTEPSLDSNAATPGGNLSGDCDDLRGCDAGTEGGNGGAGECDDLGRCGGADAGAPGGGDECDDLGHCGGRDAGVAPIPDAGTPDGRGCGSCQCKSSPCACACSQGSY